MPLAALVVRETVGPLRIGAAVVGFIGVLIMLRPGSGGEFAIGGGSLPDLRRSSPAVHERWVEIVVGGERQDVGMPGFSDRLNADDARLIEVYVREMARPR